VRPYRTRLILGLICGILLALATAACIPSLKLVGNLVLKQDDTIQFQVDPDENPPAIFIRPFVQWLTEHLPKSSFLTRNSYRHRLLLPVVMFCRSLFNYLNILPGELGLGARHCLICERKCSQHLQSLPLSFFNQSNTGDLISRVTNDTQSLRTIIGSSPRSLVSDPITVFGLFALLMFQQPWLTLLFPSSVVPVCVIPISAYSRKVRPLRQGDANPRRGSFKTDARILHRQPDHQAYNLEDKMLDEFQLIRKSLSGRSCASLARNEIRVGNVEFLGGVGVTTDFILCHRHPKTMPSGDSWASS